MKYITRVCLSMYKVNMTVADSFNDSGCGPNYEHDEEHNEKHDEGDYPHLNLNSGISLDNLNTHGVFKILRDIPDKSRLAQSLLNEHEKLKSSEDSKIPGTKNVQFDAWNAKVKKYIENTPFKLHSNPTASTIKPNSLFQKINELVKDHPDLEKYVHDHGTIKNFKDRNKWNREVLRYCKNRIDLGPKPVRTKKETNNVNATAHHLKHFSVEERKNKHGYYLNISVKEHDNHDKPSTVAYKDDRHKTHTNKLLHDGYHAPEFKYNYPHESKPYKFVKPFQSDAMGRPVVQDGVGRL